MTIRTVSPNSNYENEFDVKDEKETKKIKLNTYTNRFIQDLGYRKIDSPYFNLLRNKQIYYKTHFFHARPQERICVIDFLIVYPTLENKSQLITELELLNRDSRKVKDLILKEYTNLSHILGDHGFNTFNYDFVHLGIYKKSKSIPIYQNSFQALFSVKPIVVPIRGDIEYDIQSDSRIDIVPLEKFPDYFPNWNKEIITLGKNIYNNSKFTYYDNQNKFDGITGALLLLWFVFTELNIFLQWDILCFSFSFLIYLGILMNILWPLHSYIMYQKFCKISKEEIFSNKWITHCEYAKPFLIRSKQLLVRPLEQAPKNKQVKSNNNLIQIHELFSKQTKEQIENRENQEFQESQVSQVSQKSQNTDIMSSIIEDRSTPPEEPVLNQEILAPKKKQKKRGIRALLHKRPTTNINIEIYKEQLGDLYAKLKITTDYYDFKHISLRILTLILICEWCKLTGGPPINIRIKEVSDDKIDQYKQIEGLLSQFLDNYPNALDVEEFYRITTAINLGHLNQKMIEHIEWKIEDYLLNFDLLPNEKKQLLYATHPRNTNTVRKIIRNTISPENLINRTKQVKPLIENVTKVTKDINGSTICSISDQKESQNQLLNKNNQDKNDQGENSRKTSIINKVDTSQLISDEITNIIDCLNYRPDDLQNFDGEVLHSYYRFKHLTENDGYKPYKTPVCIFAFDSSIHHSKYLQEFIDITKQMPEIATYIIYDFINTRPEIRDRDDFQPINEPTIWIRDEVLNIDMKIPFKTSHLANSLADLRDLINDKKQQGELTIGEDVKIVNKFEQII
ncbi:MAG: hypothetical protein ACTSO9_20220, partial [Candidatus Helarchaeota archaeon]